MPSPMSHPARRRGLPPCWHYATPPTGRSTKRCRRHVRPSGGPSICSTAGSRPPAVSVSCHGSAPEPETPPICSERLGPAFSLGGAVCATGCCCSTPGKTAQSGPTAGRKDRLRLPVRRSQRGHRRRNTGRVRPADRSPVRPGQGPDRGKGRKGPGLVANREALASCRGAWTEAEALADKAFGPESPAPLIGEGQPANNG